MQSTDANNLPSEDLKASAAALIDDTVLNTKLPFVVVEAFEKKIVGIYATEAAAIAASVVANRKSSGDARFLLANVVGETYLGEYKAREGVAPDYSAFEEALEKAQAEAQAQADIAADLRSKIGELEVALAAAVKPAAKDAPKK